MLKIEHIFLKGLLRNKEMSDTKICKKCGRELPIEQFRQEKSKYGKLYYRGTCKECERKHWREYVKVKNRINFSDNQQINVQRKFKEIQKERVLDISKIDIIPLGTDEIFVQLMDYKNTWLSNYGRVITCAYGKFGLLGGSYINGELRYSVRKDVFYDGKWIYQQSYLYAPKAVIDTFIVNEDKANNIYIWHGGYDKQDCYYRNLYPLNQEQYRIVRHHFLKTGDDSEEFILKVMNEIKYKPDNWSAKLMQPVMYGVGYHGTLYKNCKDEAYNKWHNMMNRCYSEAVHERQPEYEGCSVCEEWKNFSNFKHWYDQNVKPWKSLGENFEIDKDILFKGNKIYSPETVSFVPKVINSLFTNGKKNRGKYPLGVYYDKTKKKFRACMSFMNTRKKLGMYNTVEDAFARYKEYKESFIKDIAERYREKIPDKVYRAMLEWKIEITD